MFNSTNCDAVSLAQLELSVIQVTEACEERSAMVARGTRCLLIFGRFCDPKRLRNSVRAFSSSGSPIGGSMSAI
jgi:hypothetical protein